MSPGAPIEEIELIYSARKLQRGRAVSLAEPRVELARAGSASPGSEFDDLRIEIRSLPERQRHILFLRYYADLDYRAIAVALGIRPGTVAAALNAAHETLRRRLPEVSNA